MAGKRKRYGGQYASDIEETSLDHTTKRQSHGNGEVENDTSDASNVIRTPTKPRRGEASGSGQKSRNSAATGFRSVSGASKLKSKSQTTTPTKRSLYINNQDVGSLGVQNADRSARRKSARTLIEPTVDDGLSEHEGHEEADLLARRILGTEEDDGGEEQNGFEAESGADSPIPATPSKRKRGRQKNKSPMPPQNLPSQEQYFWQNRPGKIKTSNKTLSSLALLNHEQYFTQIDAYEDPHKTSYDYLYSIHSRAFPQWDFELSQSFNLCLYGYGSKRKLVTAFADYLHSLSPSGRPKILVVNGYDQTLTLRTLFTTLATLVFDCTLSTLPSKLGNQPREILSSILDQLQKHGLPDDLRLYVFINSLDAPPLRRSPTPSLLAELAACPHIHLLATCDTPNFPLLWSTTLRDEYNFVFHDTTTFISYGEAEIPSVTDSVNELVGRSARSMKGKEGVGFVLRSLPENARNLYRVLIAELLAAMDDADGGMGGEGGMEYRVLYQKVVEEFICSNEMGFRQLLKEFFDHQMVISKRDGTGAELLGVPWRREEMEAILEDLIG